MANNKIGYSMRNIDLINYQQKDLTNESLGEKLELVIRKIPAAEVTLSDILEIIGDDSLMFLTIFLSLVFLVPVSIPGVSTVFGTAILLIGISRLFSRKLWLPKRIADRKIAGENLTVVLNRALIWFRRLEKIGHSRRFYWLATNGNINLLNKLSFILAALLLMVPFGFIPFSNTLPAIALIFLSLGAIQKDGSKVLIGHLANLATIIYFLALIAGGGVTLQEIWRYLSG